MKTNKELTWDVQALRIPSVMSVEYIRKMSGQWVEVIIDGSVSLRDLQKLADHFGTQDMRIYSEHAYDELFSCSQSRIAISNATTGLE